MNTIVKISLLATVMVCSFTSCREEEKTTNETAQEMIDEAEEVDTKDDKVKIKSADGSETKIKYDENGNVEKIKTDDNY